MKSIKLFSLISVLCFALSIGSAVAGTKEKALFVNLTSNEMNRAAMAISFSTRVLEQKKMPATIFLNVDGVRLANKNIPGSRHVSGKTLQEMLVQFMASGGKVIVCPMCMKNVGGMTTADLINGAMVGGSDVTWPALFAENTTVLNY